jgi:predicted metalloprotease with PDZ domain
MNSTVKPVRLALSVLLLAAAGAGVSCCGNADEKATPAPTANATPAPAPAPAAAKVETKPVAPASANPTPAPSRAADDSAEPPSREAMKVSFGIMPGDYEDTEAGVLVGALTPGGSAEAAGIRENDRLMTWNGQEIKDIRSWMGYMVKANPGDVVDVGVKRNGTIVPIKVKLKARQE